MNKYPDTDKWSVLILSTGYGNEELRSLTLEYIKTLGFEAHVYDAPGYPVDPMLHSHASCIEAISQHDIILAFADESEGGEFQVTQAPVEMVKDLRNRGALPTDGSQIPVPTIFQVEVLTAKSLGKPTLVFMPKTVQASVQANLQFLQQGALQVKALTSFPPDLEELIQNSKWEELLSNFEVPTASIGSFRHVVFLEKLSKEAPNFISYYESNRIEDLKAEIKSRLSGVAEHLVKQHIIQVNDKIETKRNPVGETSLQDLLNQGLIIASPFDTLSGTVSPPLFSTPSNKGQIAQSLVDNKDVLLLGNPGLGKTTASLLSFRDLAKEAESGVRGVVPLYANWRTLPDNVFYGAGHNIVISTDSFIRVLIGFPFGREPWPASLDLPKMNWILVLDGLDESPLERASLIKVIEVLTKEAKLFVTCRQHNYERHLQNSKHYFNLVVRLVPWSDENISEYLQALLASGKSRAHSFISTWLSQHQFTYFMSLPLWLSMLTYLAERPTQHISDVRLSEIGEYDLLRVCMDAVEEDERERYAVSNDSKEDLRKLWGLSAWELHRARRERRILSLRELERALGIKLTDNNSLGEAVLALLDTVGVQVYGFFHEFFQEYWLAEYLVDRLVDDQIDAKQLAGYFSYQRSVITNALIRSRIKLREDIPKISLRLQAAFGSANEVGDRSLFTQNQLVYLLGRIDESQFNKTFLRLIWGSSEAPSFVKHSAAFAAVILGDERIEGEYYNLLSTSDTDDEMNRGYHLYYYGDIDAKESAMPIIDDGKSEAEASLHQLFRRLNRTESRHMNLRRIEMLTIRRFLETGRALPRDIQSPHSIIAKVVEDARSYKLSDEYVKGVEGEAERVLKLISD